MLAHVLGAILVFTVFAMQTEQHAQSAQILRQQLLFLLTVILFLATARAALYALLTSIVLGRKLLLGALVSESTRESIAMERFRVQLIRPHLQALPQSMNVYVL